MSEDILEFLGLVGVVVHNALTRLWVKLARGVPRGDILLSRGIAMTFLGVQMEQFRTLHVLDGLQDAH